jgi:RNA:NAD 2'-phosphotransferase (TPT1/KptA family)
VDVVRLGKRLSSVLRHAPDSVGLTLAGPAGSTSTTCSPRSRSTAERNLAAILAEGLCPGTGTRCT